MMSPVTLIPEDIRSIYPLYDYNHAFSILTVDCAEEFIDVCKAIRKWDAKELVGGKRQMLIRQKNSWVSSGSGSLPSA